MGLLDSNDDQIKKDYQYGKTVGAMKSLKEEVAKFKDKGGSAGLVRGLAQAVLYCIQCTDQGMKKSPDFKEWMTMRADALEVGKALVEKFPTASDCEIIKPYLKDPNKRF